MSEFHCAVAHTSEAEVRDSRSTPWWTALVQAPVIGALYSVIGLRYVTGMAMVCWVLFNFLDARWVPNPPLIPVLIAWVVLYTMPFRVLLAVFSARALLSGVKPGYYQRGGNVHLRL